MKSDNAFIHLESASIEKQIILRYFLYPLFHNSCSELLNDSFLSESISFLRYLTKSTNPAYVSDFMLKNLVNYLDTDMWYQCEFLGELYLSLGHQFPKSLIQSTLFNSCYQLSEDSAVVSSPESPSLPSVPAHFNEKIQTFRGLISESYPEISVVNRYNANSISLRSHERKTFKRNLYDSDLKFCDSNWRNSTDVDICGRSLLYS